MQPKEQRTSAFRQCGVGLIEVLITVFILAIGLLGIAGTQFMSKRANYEATQRTTATLLANDILERMRANSAPNAAGASMLSDYVANAGTVTTNPADPKAGETNAIMLRDLWEWAQAISGATETRAVGVGVPENTGGLVTPTACLYTTVLAGNPTQSGRYMVAIVWRGTAKLSDPVNPNPPVAPDPDPYACGRDSGNYNSNDPDPVVDAHRRILIVDAYIAQEAGL